MAWGLKMGELGAARNAKAAIQVAIAFISDLVGVLPSLPRIGRTLFLSGMNRSDYGRWEKPESLEAWWETRTQKVATLVPKGTRVIEFGAGRGWLEVVPRSKLHLHCLRPGRSWPGNDHMRLERTAPPRP